LDVFIYHPGSSFYRFNYLLYPCTPAILALERQKQEVREFEVSWLHVATLSQKKKKKKTFIKNSLT
jgi:hypothetical protein